MIAITTSNSIRVNRRRAFLMVSSVSLFGRWLDARGDTPRRCSTRRCTRRMQSSSPAVSCGNVAPRRGRGNLPEAGKARYGGPHKAWGRFFLREYSMELPVCTITSGPGALKYGEKTLEHSNWNRSRMPDAEDGRSSCAGMDYGGWNNGVGTDCRCGRVGPETGL